MTNRRPNLKLKTMMVIALGVLAGLSSSTSSFGAPIPSFRLSNSGPKLTGVAANVIPPGAIVVSSNPADSPLTILGGSSGFDTSALKVFLGEGTAPDNTPLQALVLDFGPDGFATGGVLNFSLNLAPTLPGYPNYNGVPELVLTPPSNSLKIEAVPVPEPVSMLVWSSLIGFGLLRARANRRSLRLQRQV
mgnify:CR=1 FL=1